MYRLIVSVGLASAFVIGPAHAARSAVDPSPSGNSSNGNGNHNRNAVGIKSPTSNRGYQHTNNGNSGGLNGTLNTLCRHATNCKLTQNLIIVVKNKYPRITAPPPPANHFLYMAGPYGVIMKR